MDTLRKAPADAVNPFVIGEDGVHRYIELLGECAWVALLRGR